MPVSTPDAITAEWLTDVLRAGGHLGDESVRSVSLQPLGTGQMSDSFRIELRYEGVPEAPGTLIAKLPAEDPTSRATAKALRNYEKEVRFYQELAPTLPVRTPAVFHADIDVEADEFVLLLEDLHPAAQGDQLVGCSREVAAAALAQLVPLHAPRWGDDSLDGLDWLVGDVADQRAMGLIILPMLWDGFQERYADVLDPVVLEAGTWLFTHLETYVDPGPTPLTITHGDYRLDNLLIAAGPPPEVVGIVDWQTVTRGPALRDVAYVLGAGLLTPDRRAHEEGLVRGYHRDLVAAGVAGYGWEQCWDDYRRGTWAGLVMAVGASMMVERTKRGDEMFLAMASRHSRHALDLVDIDAG